MVSTSCHFSEDLLIVSRSSRAGQSLTLMPCSRRWRVDQPPLDHPPETGAVELTPGVPSVLPADEEPDDVPLAMKRTVSVIPMMIMMPTEAITKATIKQAASLGPELLRTILDIPRS
jgi:hypothetical protein